MRAKKNTALCNDIRRGIKYIGHEWFRIEYSPGYRYYYCSRCLTEFKVPDSILTTGKAA